MPKLRSWNIKTIGVIFIVTLMVAGAVLTTVSLIIKHDISLFKSVWSEFEESRSVKTRLVTAFRSDVGYGGMIHHFKNYVLRHEKWRAEIVERKLDAARGVLAGYLELITSDTERRAVEELRKVLAAYSDALQTARKLVALGHSSEEIDRAVWVNDDPAFKSLAVLDREIAAGQQTSSVQISKSKTLSALRDALGYGGMIHHFKNFMLRHDKSRVETVRAKIDTAFTALKKYRSLGLTPAEETAVGGIRRVLENYIEALARAQIQIDQGKPTAEIDRLVRVDDGPAFQGLEVLDREAAHQAEIKSAKVTRSLDLFSTLINTTSWITIGLMLFLFSLSVWFLRYRIILPLGRLTRITTRLAFGDNSVNVDSSLWKTDEIGEMASALKIFRDNDIARQRTEEALRQAQKMQAVGQLTGGVAHEFNNLLTVIIGNLEYAKEKTEDGQEVDISVKRALAAADRGAVLTQRLLAFSRKQVLQPRPIDLNELKPGLLDLLRPALSETIEVKREFARDLWLVSIDREQIETAILTLAINARDAMPEGGALTIAAANVRLGIDDLAEEAELEPGDYVLLSVTDTGVGMPPEELEHVFEPFYTTKEVGKGTGLGLSMVHGFVNQSGGHVKIVSEAGSGTTVKIYLPRSTEASAQSDEE